MMTEPLNPRIAVVVPVRNAMRFLPGTIDSVVAAVQQYGNAELILVDNGSSDGTWEFLQTHHAANATLLRLAQGNISCVRNYGAKQSESEFISFLDCNCLVKPGYLQMAAEFFARSGADASGCRCDLPEAPNWLEETWENLRHVRRDGNVHYIPSANFIVRRRAFAAVGGFDESLRTGEDAELCQRLLAAGYSVQSSTAIRAIHLGNPRNPREFFAKEIWHGLGMMGTTHGFNLDKPVVATLAHLVFLLAAAGYASFGAQALAVRIATGCLLALLAPAPFAGVIFVFSLSQCPGDCTAASDVARHGGCDETPGRTAQECTVIIAFRPRAACMRNSDER